MIAAKYTDDESRWAALVRRDAEADGAFVFSVRTTGVYCRPSCASRRANRENVRFHATNEDAERAGFRECRRCKPNELSLVERQRDSVLRACRLIEKSDETPDLTELATSVGMSRFHFHRLFKRITGVTPKQYATASRSEKVRSELVNGSTVTETIYTSGFGSNGRFYATATDRLGMTPTKYRKGGDGLAIRFAVGECSLGAVLVAATDRGVCAILLDDDADVLAGELQDRFPRAEIVPGDVAFDDWVAKVVGMVERPELGIDLPLDIRGTAFQIRVWEALRRIPCGSTTTYGELAAALGAPQAARAVGAACGANPIAVAIPCHRVVRTDETLCGYRWGIERKAELLKREKAAASQLA